MLAAATMILTVLSLAMLSARDEPAAATVPAPVALVPYLPLAADTEADAAVDLDLVAHKRTLQLSLAVASSSSTRVQAAQQQRSSRSQQRQSSTAVKVNSSGAKSKVIKFALAQVGKPYVWAAAGPNSYDCSGLVMAAYAQIGVRLPHQTGGIIRYGTPVSRANLQPGDIVFPQSGHVAIYLGDGMMVHAPHPGDHVRVAKLYGFYAGRRI